MMATNSFWPLKTSSKKARRKSRPYHDPEYEPRVQAALPGVNEKKYMSLVAAAREDVGVCCTFLSFICQKIVIQLSYTTLIDRANTKHRPYREAAIKPQLVSHSRVWACHAQVDGTIYCLEDAI